jgi:hypothetical protein
MISIRPHALPVFTPEFMRELEFHLDKKPQTFVDEFMQVLEDTCEKYKTSGIVPSDNLWWDEEDS